jgi:hypothetical protein
MGHIVSNQIEAVRSEILQYLNLDPGARRNHAELKSPSEKFRLETWTIKQTKPDVNWYVTEIRISEGDELLFNFYATFHRIFFSWIEWNASELLIGAEDIYGGQTIIDPATRKMSSYSPNDTDGFIWTDYHLSPDGMKLAVEGCFWACPTIVRIYDFEDPFNLPLSLIKEVRSVGENFKIIGWDGSSRIRVATDSPGVDKTVAIEG